MKTNSWTIQTTASSTINTILGWGQTTLTAITNRATTATSKDETQHKIADTDLHLMEEGRRDGDHVIITINNDHQLRENQQRHQLGL